MARVRLTPRKIEQALRASGGNVADAARTLGVARRTLYKHIAASEKLKEILHDARQELVDVAESALLQSIRKGNIAAIIFALKTQGRDRGWIERHDVTLDGGALRVVVKLGDGVDGKEEADADV